MFARTKTAIFAIPTFFLFLLPSCANSPEASNPSDSSNVTFAEYVNDRIAEFDQIDNDRRNVLDPLIDAITRHSEDGKVELVFICTHNSRRSLMSQNWAKAAAVHYGFDNVTTYSGGTEASAFHPNAIAALERSGFDIEQMDGSENPVHKVMFPGLEDPMYCSSKTYLDDQNPRYGFIAVMSCSAADAACPIVQGAETRVPVTYEDPKAFDGTDREAQAYDERCAQIARELFFAFSEAKKRMQQG
ncbi:MAG: protein-tyrosine-phosphatase [Planctomycetota bacterium]